MDKGIDKEKEVLKYLKNIVNKLINLNARIHQLEQKQVEMEKIVCSGFAYINKGMRANNEAWQQTKTIMSELANVQEETRDDLADYGGTIQESTWIKIIWV